MISMFEFFLGVLIVALIGVLIMTIAERHPKVVWFGFGILMIPYILMALDMVGLL